MKRISDNYARYDSLIIILSLSSKFQRRRLVAFFDSFTVKIFCRKLFERNAKPIAGTYYHIPVEVLSIMCRYNVRLERIYDFEHLLYHPKLPLSPLFFRSSEIGEYSLEPIRMSGERTIYTDTNLLNFIFVCIEACGLQVEGHFQDLVVIVIPLEETFTC